MPILKENRKRYPPFWKALSSYLRVRRAGGRCEHRDENGERCIARQGRPTPTSFDRAWRDFDPMTDEDMTDDDLPKVVLTVAHLDHTPENCAVWNLAVWCQKHHLAYDMPNHVAKAAETRRRKIREAGQMEIATT